MPGYSHKSNGPKPSTTKAKNQSKTDKTVIHSKIQAANADNYQWLRHSSKLKNQIKDTEEHKHSGIGYSFTFPTCRKSTVRRVNRFSSDIKDKERRSYFKCGHHKFPKRCLGWLFNRFTAQQTAKISKELGLRKGFTATNLAQLPSNIICAKNGEEYVKSAKRKDDPGKGASPLQMDLVQTEEGELTPRSSQYNKLAIHCGEVEKRLIRDGDSTFQDEEAKLIIACLSKAETLHKKLQPKTADLPCMYGSGFWKRPTVTGEWFKGAGKWSKTSVKLNTITEYSKTVAEIRRAKLLKS